ncbi:hypothetical protein C791_6531 [Amycolatopsis azurea DSM 43854]|uniref:Uncharacterized protein n=1 Tax=Amycolatopsis azurea DSM 43854 TaxID=1238180 RepID=M2PWK5_9PSEU|nr:hypothetical protein C791_6531 [Amycolatopsis azurea DSM 43854]
MVLRYWAPPPRCGQRRQQDSSSARLGARDGRPTRSRVRPHRPDLQAGGR